MVEWSLTKGTLDTIPHEYAHIYIDLLRASPIVQQGINKFKMEGDTLEKAEERLVQYIGEYYANRIQGSLYKRMGIWLKQFWLNIKKAFGRLNLKTKEDIGNYLAEKFYQDSISKQTFQKKGVERLQEIPINSQAWVQSYRTIEEGYEAFKTYMTEKTDFRDVAINIDQERALISHYYEGLLSKGMNSLHEPILLSWLADNKYSTDEMGTVNLDLNLLILNFHL